MFTDNPVQQQPTPEPQVFDSAGLAAHLQGAAPAEPATNPDAIVEEIGGLPKDQFFGALRSVLGDDVPDIDTVVNRFQAGGRIGEYEAKLRELEDRAKISPYHSPLSESVDKLLREGKQAPELLSFIQLATLDVDSLSPIDAIMRHYELTKHGFTPEERAALIENDLGFNLMETETLSARESAQLKLRQQDAVAFLKSQQVSAQNPEAVQRAQAQEQTAQQYRQIWQDNIPALDARQAFEIQVNPDVKESFAFNPSDAALEAARQAVMATINANPLAYPPNQQTAAQLQEMMKQFTILADMPRFTEAMYKDAYAKATESVAARMSGNAAAITRPQGQQRNIPNPGAENVIQPGGWIN